MSRALVHRATRAIDGAPAMPFLVAAGIGLLLIALAPKLLADPDTYSHIALGRWMLAHASVPDTDPLSQTMRGAPWIAFEWLSQVLYAEAHALAGWAGVVVLTSGAAALTFGLLTYRLQRVWQPTAVIAAVLAALVLVAPHMLARPHMLAMPVMVTWIGALIAANDERRPPPLWLVPLMTLWANLHGSFTFGLAMLGPIVLEGLIEAPRGDWPRVIRQWAVFGLLALAAACINPYGPEMILVTFRTIALGAALNVITEWRPQNFSHLGAYELIVLAGFALALWRGVKLPPLRILMVFGVLHLSLSQVRHADLLGLLAPIFLARPLAAQIAGLAATRVTSWSRAGVPLAGACVFALMVGAAAARPAVAPPAANTPAAALRAIDLAKAGPIFNDYNFGAYLDFIGVPPFIDGRTELYGSAYVLRYDRAINLQDVPDLVRLLNQYKIGTTLLAPDTPAVAFLDRLPGWKRVYADDVAVVHQRTAR